MNTIIIVARYRTWAIPFAFISMALFHLIFVWNRKLTFYKLMGSGNNGSFDIVPDLHQWVILINTEECKELSEEHVYSLTGVFFRIWNRIFTKISLSFFYSHYKDMVNGMEATPSKAEPSQTIPTLSQHSPEPQSV